MRFHVLNKRVLCTIHAWCFIIAYNNYPAFTGIALEYAGLLWTGRCIYIGAAASPPRFGHRNILGNHNFSGRRQQPKKLIFFLFLYENIEFILSSVTSEMKCPKSVFSNYWVGWIGQSNLKWNYYLHRVSKKTVPTYILLLVCQIWTDFNKNWKDCPWISP